jgi:hypothetical protein
MILNHFFEIILHAFCFLFLPLDDWRTSETSGGGNNFVRILVGISFFETWTDVDGWMDVGVKACNFHGLFST